MEEQVYNFLVKQATEQKTTKKAVIQEALKQYEKTELKRKIVEWLKERSEEYQDITQEFREAQCISLDTAENGI